MSKSRCIRLNWEEEMNIDLKSNNGFIVKEKSFNKEQRNMYGMHSPLFDGDIEENEDENKNFTERRKKNNRGKGKTDNNKILRMTAWIKIDAYKIIHPIYYKLLASAIGNSEFEAILEYGFNHELTGKKAPNSPFVGIGMIEFYNRFDEIMEYYRKKRKNKPSKIELIDICINEKASVFSSGIPVFSSKLRPVSFNGETFAFGKCDAKFSAIYSQVELLNDSSKLNAKIERLRKKGDDKSMAKISKLSDLMILYNIQTRLMDVWKLIFEMINTKFGHIRDQVLGGRVNYSSRSVIIPDPTLRANEIRVCYCAFLELYRYEIIMYISILNDVDINRAKEIWEEAKLHLDESVYEIMKYIVENKKAYSDINRNPTINHGSYLTMKIIEVKKLYNEDYTMSLPISVLNLYNADFDGDTLNNFSLKTHKMIKEHDEAYNPAKTMFISRNDGLFNSEVNLIKDQIIGLYQFNNI